MKKLKLRGWRLDNLDKDKLWDIVLTAAAEPAVKQAAARLIFDLGFEGTEWAEKTILGYKVRARKLLRALLLEDPESYGLEAIDPEEIKESKTSEELASFCQVPVTRVYELAKGAPSNGLPEAEWPLGRTLRGRGWRFPVETARLYARRLLGMEE